MSTSNHAYLCGSDNFTQARGLLVALCQPPNLQEALVVIFGHLIPVGGAQETGM